MVVLFFTAIIVGIVFYSENLENKELVKTIQNQKDTAEHILEQINIRYNDSLLIKEVGQVTSSLMDIDKLLKKVVDIMEKRLEYNQIMFLAVRIG